MDQKKMVETEFIEDVLKQLEKYLIEKNAFELVGDNYDLILIVPSEKFAPDTKYSLLVSAQTLDHLEQREGTREILTYFKKTLSPLHYNALSRINLLHSDELFVKSLKHVFVARKKIHEVEDIAITGVKINYAYLVKSLVLDKLIEGSALILETKGKFGFNETINAGIIRIEKNFDVIYYTGKGLNEIWRAEMNGENLENVKFLKAKSENYLFEYKYISKINLKDIEKVI